jgi:hypothetical protein
VKKYKIKASRSGDVMGPVSVKAELEAKIEVDMPLLSLEAGDMSIWFLRHTSALLS